MVTAILGNKTGIEKARRDLENESGIYTYGYDAIGRLESVSKDGSALRSYAYDAFGNRTALTEPGGVTRYAYNALNQLIAKTEIMTEPQGGIYTAPQAAARNNIQENIQLNIQLNIELNTQLSTQLSTQSNIQKNLRTETTYRYDRRGNLSLVLENGLMKNEYVYGALNRLEAAANAQGETARYIYNGLGHRVRKETGKGNPESMGLHSPETSLNPAKKLESTNFAPTAAIDYVLDLTKGYHNLLQKSEDGATQTYLWDGNVAGMIDEVHGTDSYYLQDEMGSPIRLLDDDGNLRDSYGYDEFGQDLYGNQGEVQPFGYTGYQHDRIAGTYFAQAREYRTGEGRFGGVDLIKGNTAMPFSLNQYGYCWGNPMMLVDLDGAWPSLNNRIVNTIESAKRNIEDAINSGIENAKKIGSSVQKTISAKIEEAKEIAKETKNSAIDFYNQHEETFETIGKVTLTIVACAAIVVGTIAVLAAAPAGVAVAVVAIVVTSIIGSGTFCGVTSGISNEMTGGSFLNGFCGGFINGSITMASTVLGYPTLGNFIGGFIGNQITENFNNMDIEDPDLKKTQEQILFTSLTMGILQASLSKFIPTSDELSNMGLSDTVGGYIAKFFLNDLNFTISNIGYILGDKFSKILKKYHKETSSECIE